MCLLLSTSTTALGIPVTGMSDVALGGLAHRRWRVHQPPAGQSSLVWDHRCGGFQGGVGNLPVQEELKWK